MKQAEDNKTIDMFDYMMEEKGKEYQANLTHLLELAICKTITEVSDEDLSRVTRVLDANDIQKG
jgi:hypothetical protein